MNPYYQRQMFLRNLQLMNLAEEAETEELSGFLGMWPDDVKSIMEKIGHSDVKVPNLKVKPLPTLSGFSSGGYKTSYIMSNLPQEFSGFGILSGSYGDIQPSHYSD